MSVDDLKDLLKIDSSAELRLLGESVAPTTVTAQARERGALPLSSWSAVVPYVPGVYRRGREVAVDPESGAEVVAGERGEEEGLWRFDTQQRVVLSLRDGEGLTVIDALDGRVSVYRVESDELPELEADLPLPLPDMAAWCATVGAARWLTEAVVAGADSPVMLDRAASMGLLVRLWVAPEGKTAERPGKVARAWIEQAWSVEQVETIEAEAVRQAWRLAERIGGAAELDSEDLADLLLARDTLASVRRVLRLAGRGTMLAGALQSIDRLAAAHASAFAGRLSPSEDDPNVDRWYAVAWQEPGAWWAVP